LLERGGLGGGLAADSRRLTLAVWSARRRLEDTRRAREATAWAERATRISARRSSSMRETITVMCVERFMILPARPRARGVKRFMVMPSSAYAAET